VTDSAYHLERTLRSGQCFRWTVTPRGARGVVDGTVARVRQRAGGLSIAWEGPKGSRERLLRHLGADQPLSAIEAALAQDAVLRRLLPKTSGIAIMRQDPWECLVSYVVSAYNNIPKIQMSVRELARRFGEPIPIRTGGAGGAPRNLLNAAGGATRNPLSAAGGTHQRRACAGGAEDDAWTFPSPQRLAEARLDGLRGCLLGYRAAYVRSLARGVADGQVDLHAMARLRFDEARALLLDLPGVGEKVADCVLLFALGRHEAFPVDVWVQRAVQRWYFGNRTQTPRTIRAWARDRFGRLAGYAQQHLFAGARYQGRWPA
jgi:N-glycosylase/DNA lyase